MSSTDRVLTSAPGRPRRDNDLASWATRVDKRVAARVGIVVGAIFASLAAISFFGRPYSFFDLKIYHGAVDWWAHGGELYTYADPSNGLGFTYPPFSAIVMLPMAMFSPAVAGWINIAASLSVLALIAYWLLGPIADRFGWSRRYVVALAVPAAAALEPVRETLGFGQVNLLLLGLIVADLIALRRGLGWAGAGVGLAAAVKITPGLFILYFLLTRQWRAAFIAAGTAIGAVLVSFAVAGETSLQYFTDVLWQTDRVGVQDATPNQALSGLLARLYDQPMAPKMIWAAFAVLLLAVGLIRASTAHSEGDELAAFAIIGLTANAVCPISWTHHLVFIVLAFAVLADLTLRRRSWRYGITTGALFALFVVSPHWIYEHNNGMSHWQDGLWGAIVENSFAIAIVVLVAVLPWRPGAEPVASREELRVPDFALVPRPRQASTTASRAGDPLVGAVRE